MPLRIRSVLSLLLLGGVGPASAWPARSPAQTLESDGSSRVVWLRPFATPLDDWINQIVPSRDSNFLVVGFLNRDGTRSDWRSLIAKLDAQGTVLWSREHGAGGGVDAYWAVAEARDGRLATAGFTTRIGNGGIDGHHAVLTADGLVVRESAFGGPAYDRFTDIAPAADGGYLLAGFTETDSAGREVLVLKSGDDGIERWRRTYGGPGNDVALYLEGTADGGFVLTGTQDDDVLTMRLDREGNEVWTRVVGAPGGNDIPHALTIHPDGRIQIVGYTQSWGSTVHDLLALTLTPGGGVVRHEVFGGPDDDRAMSSAMDGHGRTWITGYTRSAGAGGWDIFLTRLDRDGSFEGFVTTFGGPGDDNGTAVLPLPDGSLLVAAYSTSIGPGRQDALLMRVTAPEWRVPHPRFTRRRID